MIQTILIVYAKVRLNRNVLICQQMTSILITNFIKQTK